MSSEGARDLVFASDATAAKLETLQTDLGEGPAIDAGESVAPVLVTDLWDHGPATAQRWPFFVTAAAGLDVRSIFAFPLRIGGVVVGTFLLHRRSTGSLRIDELAAALRTSDAMTLALLHPDSHGELPSGDTVRERDTTREDPVRSLPSAVVHQATGMVMVQLDTSIVDALAQLRARAFLEDVTLHALAADVVDGRRRFAKEVR
jgi:GAF domain-containing protein